MTEYQYADSDTGAITTEGRHVATNNLRVIDKETGERYLYVVEANAVDGWFQRMTLNECGRALFNPKLRTLSTEFVYRPIRILDMADA